MNAHTTARAIASLVLLVSFGASAGALDIRTYAGEFDLRIPQDPEATKGWMADAILDVPDHFEIQDVDVGITITHEQVFDLQIYLESPSETTVLLNMYDPFTEFFEGTDYIQTIFDDDADVPIEEALPPFTGRFRPKAPNLLADFDGQDTFGPWRLRVYDAFHADTGVLTHFDLTFTVPEPVSVAVLLVGALLVRR